jgi:putative transposase
MVDYIEQHKDEFGVEPICTTLEFPTSTYYAAKSRLPSARTMRDALLLPLLLTLWIANYRVYGARKLWKAMGRAGEDVGRDQVARLMRQLGIQGVNRSKKVRTTRPDERAARHPDLVDRQFVADRPNALWVTDLTFVPTWSGVAYVCFIVDAYSRMIVGWRCASNMRTEMVLDALEMARWSRGTVLEGLVCHSDAGSQAVFKRSSQHPDLRGCDGKVRGVGAGADGTAADVLAGPGDGVATRAHAGVLDGDRSGREQRGCGSRGGGVPGGRFALVPSRRGHAIGPFHAALGALSLVR